MRKVKISAMSARQKFNGCDPDYIANVCHATCCDAPSRPTGCLVTIHPTEQAAIEGIGGVVSNGLLQPKQGAKGCPFKQGDGLCSIHYSGVKPFGCIASPFTLNKNGTLIIRNRYRMLKCFDDGKRLPAYVAFRESLNLIFGDDEAQRICDHLDDGGGDMQATISERNYKILMDNDEIKKQDKANPNHVADGLLMQSDSGNDPQFYYKKQQKEKELGRELTTEEFQRDYYEGPDSYQTGTSIFDPVLTELVYTWFSPAGAHILDPFAGGSVRGIVAGYIGRDYTGVDLRAEQVEANRVQADEMIDGDTKPQWIVGNSLTDIPNERYDLVFSCPPYFDLEIYSEDPADLSNYDGYDAFLEDYRRIIAQAVDHLRNDRFACFVVGDIRDKNGIYRNFVADTIDAFQTAGAQLYNEAILVTAVGSLALRVGRQFTAGRKLGKTHQNVLVFVKGDPKAAADYCGPVEVAELNDTDYQVGD